MMSIKPILFSAPMIRAILEGRKTQTRRVIGQMLTEVDNFQAVGFDKTTGRRVWETWCASKPVNAFKVGKHCVSPHLFTHAPEDLLYVREAWRTECDYYNDLAPSEMGGEEAILYEADADLSENKPTGRARASMHMPRWASRITLKVTEVRVELLQDIKPSGCTAEGIKGPTTTAVDCDLSREAFRALWDSIATRNDGLYAWDKNPWVAAYTFEPIFQNVDQIGEGR